MIQKIVSLNLALFLGAFSLTSVAADKADLDKMWKMLKSQQKEIERLKKQNKRLSNQLDASAAMIEKNNQSSSSTSSKSKSSSSNSSSFSKQSGSRTTIGGYGELHYNNTESKKEIDFHRFVLFFGHRFSDRVSFFSELELEHALSGDGKPGEVELEQAYIEYALSDQHKIKAGVFLLPIGFLNETHEPNTFYGVERNPVEKNIIPTTWWEAGVAMNGQIGTQGLSYDIGVHSGLKLSSSSSYAIRSGRQKAASATAEDYAMTARIKWSGLPGLSVAASVNYQDNAGQSTDADIGSATLFEANVSYQRQGFGLRALYAQWDVDGAGPKSIGADKQEGWFIEPSYRFNKHWGVFVRYNEWDNKANSASDSKVEQLDAGINYWINDNVAIKFDVQDQSGAGNNDGFNLGIGFQF